MIDVVPVATAWWAGFTIMSRCRRVEGLRWGRRLRGVWLSLASTSCCSYLSACHASSNASTPVRLFGTGMVCSKLSHRFSSSSSRVLAWSLCRFCVWTCRMFLALLLWPVTSVRPCSWTLRRPSISSSFPFITIFLTTLHNASGPFSSEWARPCFSIFWFFL